MAHIYVRTPGFKVVKRGERLEVVTPGEAGECVLSEPLRTIDGVSLFGNVQITTQALVELLDRQVTVTWLTGSGRFRGRATPASSRGETLRLEQARRALVEEHRLELARELVAAKIRNSATVLCDEAANYPHVGLLETRDTLLDLAARSLSATRLEEVLGVEGAAAAAYFRQFPVLDRAGLGWEGRRRRPPPDPVNSLLSLGYTLAGQELEGQAAAQGLDPGFGFLHGVTDGRASLALDLLEPFRPLAVDRLVFTLLNRGTLKASDFARRVDGRGGVVLVPEALRLFLHAWEASLDESHPWAPKGMRQAMVDQVDGFVGWLRGAAWRPFQKEDAR